MTDHKFTDDEIIKGLELCYTPKGTTSTCAKCPFHKFRALCKVERDSAALALINRQKANLQEVITLNSKLEAENARLQKLLDFYEETSGNKKAKAEAIKEFAERLKIILDGKSSGYLFIPEIRFDNLVKEMTEVPK